MPTEPDAALALRIVRDLMIYTRGRPYQWVSLPTIERRLMLDDNETTDAGLIWAIEKGWLLRRGEYSYGLTDAGRKAGKG